MPTCLDCLRWNLGRGLDPENRLNDGYCPHHDRPTEPDMEACAPKDGFIENVARKKRLERERAKREAAKEAALSPRKEKLA